MRILHFHKYLYSGGIEAIICALANEMSKSHDVTVCTVYPSNNGDIFRRRLDERINVETIGKEDSRPPIKEIFKIARYIRNGGFDVVNLHGYFFYYVLAVLLYHKLVRFFYTVHSDAYEENSKWDRRILWYKRFCFKRGWVKPITISSASDESFYRVYGCKGRMINNGIARPSIVDVSDIVSKYKISPATQLFVHVGRISAEKNQVMLCRVFKSLIDDGADVALILAGPNHRPDIMDEMQTYFSNRIAYLGECSEVPSLFSAADGMCLSSHFEGLPVVLLESLAVGCIPICTPVGGIVNVIDGTNGVLSKEISMDSYKEAVISVLKMSSEERDVMKENCRQSFRKYSIEETTKRYLEYYSEKSHN